MSTPIDHMFRVIACAAGTWILASKNKVFPTIEVAQKYVGQMDPGWAPELMTVRQLRAAYEIGGKCRCGKCMCCDLRHDVRYHEINLRPRPEQVVT
jgi:hypothetical protein